MGDIFREVDDEVRQARLMRVWTQYGRYLILTIVAIVLTTAGKVGWDELKTRGMMADSTRFAGALKLAESAQYEQAALSFGLMADESGTGYPQLAALRQAAALVSNGEPNKAIAVYEKLADSSDVDPIVAELAVILAAIHTLDQGLSGETINNLELISQRAGPWQHLAMEITALSIMQSGDMSEAQNLLVALANDPTAPPGTRLRAKKLIATNHGTFD